MTALDDIRTVVELAVLTEDRTDAEQRALLRVAMKADKEANRASVTNRREGPAWRLTALVEDGQSVRLSETDRARVVERADRWDKEGPQS